MAEYLIEHNEELENEIKDAAKPIVREIIKTEIKYVRAMVGDDASDEEFQQALNYVVALLMESIVSNANEAYEEILEEEDF